MKVEDSKYVEQPLKRKGSRQLILDFFLANIGRVIEGEEFRQVSGNVSEVLSYHNSAIVWSLASYVYLSRAYNYAD